MHHLYTSYTALVAELTHGDVSYEQLMTGLFFFGCERGAVEEGARQPVTRPSFPPAPDGQPVDPMLIIRRSNGLHEHTARIAVAMAVEFAAAAPTPRVAFRKPRKPWPEDWNQLWTLLQGNRVPGMKVLETVWINRIADAECSRSTIERVLTGMAEIVVHR